MLILALDTDAIEIVLGEAIATNQLPCVASWRDIDSTGSGTFTIGRTRTATNSTTAVDFVTGPGAGDPQPARVIDYLSVYNNDTIGHTIIISYDANGTAYAITRVSLGTGERLEYHDRGGFQVIQKNGSVKRAAIPGTHEVHTDNVVYSKALQYDVANSDTTANTMYSVPGLSFPVEKGQSYWFRFFITFTANATTSGTRFGITSPNTFGSTVGLKYRSEYTTASSSQRTLGEGWNNVFDVPSSANADVGATGCNTAEIEGFCSFNEDGFVTARFACEVAGPTATITVKAGSVVHWCPVT